MLLIFAFLIALSFAQQPGQKIESLPGYNSSVPFPEMYSGYIPLNDEYGKELYYVLVKSAKPNAPLIFWVI